MAGHDQLFKDLLRAFFGDLLHLTVPSAAQAVDLVSPVFLDKEFFTDFPTGRRRTLDLLVRLPSLSRPSTALLVHVEIEARATTAMGARLRHYSHQIEGRHQGQLLSIVVNLRRGQPGVQCRKVQGELHGAAFSEFRYVTWGLAGADALAALESTRPLAWACAALMRAPHRSRAEHKLACLKRIAVADLSDVQRLLLVNCVETYLQLNLEEARELADLSASPESREVEAMAMTWADRLIAQGRQEGREKGREEGRREGEEQAVRTLREVLMDLLVQRFGPLPQDARGRIEAIESARQLTRLAKRVLVVRSLAEMKLG